HVRERRELQDAITAIRENEALDRVGRRLFPNGERYLKSGAEMADLFSDLPEALENTVELADRCSFSPGELRYYYPSEWIPAGESAQSYLTKLVWKGAEWRYPEGVPEDVRRQIGHELALIAQLQYADYFLTIYEIVEYARAREILCQGRGSAANSVVCYCLAITAIDPVRMNLLFERFLSVERDEPPDIDVDFEHERREEVIQHIYEKYGRHRAGMVAALVTYRDRSITRDLSKALGFDAEKEPAKTETKRFAALSEEIRAFPRHLSIHSGGFTLSAVPIIETVPIEPARMEGRTIVQWDKEDLAAIGLLKVDVLALGMLTALKRTFDLVKPREELTVATIPASDPKTYAMIQRGDTVGVFQIESRAQMNMLKRLRPTKFYELVVQVAIVRPGPIVGKMVHPYLRRRRGLEPVDYPHEDLKPILERTFGVPLFQEQVMKIAVIMAGFTPGEADELRRAIGAWRSSGTIEKMGLKLAAGLRAKGIAEEWVERLFNQVKGFAEYGFPESHAASF
ncbi:MAG: error-prone DNA polymerase, partial [Bdellovibrionota bacterium]